MIDLNKEAYDSANFNTHQNDQEHLSLQEQQQQQQQQQHHTFESSDGSFKDLDKEKDPLKTIPVAAQEMQKTASNSSNLTTCSNSSSKSTNHSFNIDQKANPIISKLSGTAHSPPTRPKSVSQKSSVRTNNRGNWTLREDCSLLETLIDHAYSLKIFKKRKYMGKFWLEISSKLSVQYNVLRNTRQCRERFKLLYCNFIKKKVEDGVMLKDDKEFPIGTSPSSPAFSTTSPSTATTPGMASVASYSPSISASASSFSNMLNMHWNNQDLPEYKKWLDLLQTCIDIFIYDNENSLDLRSLSNKRPLKLASVKQNTKSDYTTGTKGSLRSNESDKNKNFERQNVAGTWLGAASPINSSNAYAHYDLNSGFHDNNSRVGTANVNPEQISSMQKIPLQTNGAELISDFKSLINKNNNNGESVSNVGNNVYNGNNPHFSNSFPMLQQDSIYQPIPTRANSQPQIEYHQTMNVTGSNAYNLEVGESRDFSQVSSRFAIPGAATSTSKDTVSHGPGEAGIGSRADFHLGTPYFGMSTVSPTISHFPDSASNVNNHGNAENASMNNENDPRTCTARTESAATMATSCFTKLSSNVFSSNGNFHDANISLHHGSNGESNSHELDGNASVDGSYQSSGAYANRNNCPSQKSVLEDMQFEDRSPMLIYESSFGKHQQGLDELVTDSFLPNAGCDFFYPYTNFHLFNLSLQQHQQHQQQLHLQQMKLNGQKSFPSSMNYHPNMNSLRTPTPVSFYPSNISEHNNNNNNTGGYNFYGSSVNSNNGYTNSYGRAASWNGYSPTLMNNGFFSPPPSKTNFNTGISSRLMSDATIGEGVPVSEHPVANASTTAYQVQYTNQTNKDSMYQDGMDGSTRSNTTMRTSSNWMKNETPEPMYNPSNAKGTGIVFASKDFNNNNNDDFNQSGVDVENDHIEMERSNSSTSHLVVPVSANHDQHTIPSKKENDEMNNDNI